jgi:hypothetical protein
MNRAIRYVHHKQTALVNANEGSERNVLKISAQSKGFEQGFNEFYESSQYKNEDEKNKPWYLKHDDNNPFLR